MSNIRLQSIIKTQTEEIVKKSSCVKHIAFINLMLQKIFDLDEFEAEDAITDGTGDKGLDAIFDLEEEGERILYFVQSKYFDNADKSIDDDAKNKMILNVSSYLRGDYKLPNANAKVEKKLKDYGDLLKEGKINKVGIVFIANGQEPNKNITDDLEKFQQEQDGTVFYEIYTEADLLGCFMPESAKSIEEIELKVIKDVGGGAATFLNLPNVELIEGKVVKVDVLDLAKVIERNRGIFNSNVRAYQSIRNKVNKEIAKTLRDPEEIKQFIYLNNGITIICENYQIKPGNEQIAITRPSIINGCQTGSTILEVYKEGKIEQNTGFVLVRIIKSEDKNVTRNIILSSNTQTAIRDRDLKSEDDIQIQLESQFEQLGYYYQRKRGMYSDKPKEKIVELEKAAQSYLSLFLDMPAEAKNKKAEIFKGYYEQIFNRDLIASQLLIGYRLFEMASEKIKEKRKSAKDDFSKSLLGNCVLHLLPLFNEWVLKPEGISIPFPDDADVHKNMEKIEKLFFDKIETVIQKLTRIVNKISQTYGKKAFNLQYFFKSSDSLHKILGSKNSPWPDYVIELDNMNYKRRKDMRYYKPCEYTINGDSKKVTYWNDLFAKLVELYGKKYEISEGNLDFIDSGSRRLIVREPGAEISWRKKLSSGLYLLTNFDSKTLCRFCFDVANQIGIGLSIKLRPTRYREIGRIKHSHKQKTEK